MHTYEALAKRLADLGVECIFGLLGEDIAKLVVSAEAAGIRFIGARHENQAVAMADGYARATGKTAVAAVTGGPGFTNSLTGINTASRFGSNVIVIVGAGSVPSKQLSNVGVLEGLGIKAYHPASPMEAMDSLDLAYAGTRQFTASVLTLPSPVLDEPWVSEASQRPTATEIGDASALQPDQTSVEAIADFLEATWAVSHPVIIAGRGAIIADAGPALQRLGELIGALMGTSLRAPALFEGDPYNIGFVGTYSNAVTSGLLGGADCVLAFGASLNKFTTFGGDLFPNAKIVQIDTDAEALGANVAVDPELAVIGDARLTAEAILATLKERNHRSDGYRSAAVRERITEYDARSEFVDTSGNGTIDPRTLALEINEVLPTNRVVVIDGAHNSAFWIPNIQVQHPNDFLQTSYAGGASSIGLSMGASIGAAVGRDDALVVACMGDAGHMMSLGDLDTAIRYRLPLVVLVANDQALGAEVHFLALENLPTDIVKMATPPFAAVAEAMGAEGFTIASLEDLDVVKKRLGQPIEGPVVVDCHIDPEVRADWLELVFSS